MKKSFFLYSLALLAAAISLTGAGCNKANTPDAGQPTAAETSRIPSGTTGWVAHVATTSYDRLARDEFGNSESSTLKHKEITMTDPQNPGTPIPTEVRVDATGDLKFDGDRITNRSEARVGSIWIQQKTTCDYRADFRPLFQPLARAAGLNMEHFRQVDENKDRILGFYGPDNWFVVFNCHGVTPTLSISFMPFTPASAQGASETWKVPVEKLK